jgi:hypothetical protein
MIQKLGDFTFDASIGGNRMDRNASNQSQTVNLAQPGIFNLNNSASPIEVFQFVSKRRTLLWNC